MVRSEDLNFTTSNPWLSNFLFSSNPYQSNNDRNYKVWNIVYILWDVYSLCRCCWNVVQYKWKVHNGKADIDLIWLKGVSMIRVDFGPISETVYIDIILNTIIER